MSNSIFDSLNPKPSGLFQFFQDSEEKRKRAIWDKAPIAFISLLAGGDEYRMDVSGRTMKYSDHGNRDSAYGWEYDHNHPKSLGGSDHIDNIQPLHWKTNLEKSDAHPISFLMGMNVPRQ
jgi:hypothetical protein